MKRLNQMGLISFTLIAVLMLIVALVGGIVLVSQRTGLSSRADSINRGQITVESKFMNGNKSTASLVNVIVYSDSGPRPDKYRLANIPDINISTLDLDRVNWVEFSYPDWAAADQPVSSIWHLDPIPGNQKVILQFHQDGQWTSLTEVPITLLPTANPLSVSAQCLTDKGATKSKIVTRWDAESIKKLETEFLWLQLYSADGTMLADYPNPDLTKSDYTFEIDTPAGNFTLVGIPYLPNASDEPLTVVKPLGFSEFTTNCSPKNLPQNVTLQYNPTGGYDLTWSGTPGYSSVPVFALNSGFQVYLGADPDLSQPICGSCQVLFQNVGTDRKLHFDNTLSGFQPRPGVVQDFTKLIKGRKYALIITAGAYRIGDKVNFTAK